VQVQLAGHTADRRACPGAADARAGRLISTRGPATATASASAVAYVRVHTRSNEQHRAREPGGRHSRRPADEPSNALFAPPPIRRPDFSTDNRAVAACVAPCRLHLHEPHIESLSCFVGLLSRTHTEGPDDSVREWHTGR
jgi:hypothetical protein